MLIGAKLTWLELGNVRMSILTNKLLLRKYVDFSRTQKLVLLSTYVHFEVRRL